MPLQPRKFFVSVFTGTPKYFTRALSWTAHGNCSENRDWNPGFSPQLSCTNTKEQNQATTSLALGLRLLRSWFHGDPALKEICASKYIIHQQVQHSPRRYAVGFLTLHMNVGQVFHLLSECSNCCVSRGFSKLSSRTWTKASLQALLPQKHLCFLLVSHHLRKSKHNLKDNVSGDEAQYYG